MSRPGDGRPLSRTEPDLRVVSDNPFNAETPIEALRGVITPTERHFVRNHFPVPMHDGVLSIGGAVRTPLTLDLADLERRPSTTIAVTLECAGNGRAFLDPPAPGEPWRLGAVGTAEWTGVRLRSLLDEAEPDPAAVEILFRGADAGLVADLGRTVAFERSLPPTDAGRSIVAYAMNGRDLAPDHGAPFRLIMPGWYGMASVKWLTSIEAITTPFRGFYQADRYVVDELPLGKIAPRAVIVSPADGAELRLGPQVIRGYAWSGGAPVEWVDVSIDGGAGWTRADLGAAPGSAWRPWELAWEPPAVGRAVLLARAVDASGERQPVEQVRNRLGYRNNAAQPVAVEVTGAESGS